MSDHRLSECPVAAGAAGYAERAISSLAQIALGCLRAFLMAGIHNLLKVHPQARLEDHRRSKAEQEAQQGEREVLRQQVRAQLEARTKWLRAPDAILRALGVPLEMEAGNPFRADLARTVRKARLTYHPDRHQVGRPLASCQSSDQPEQSVLGTPNGIELMYTEQVVDTATLGCALWVSHTHRIVLQQC